MREKKTEKEITIKLFLEEEGRGGMKLHVLQACCCCYPIWTTCFTICWLLKPSTQLHSILVFLLSVSRGWGFLGMAGIILSSLWGWDVHKMNEFHAVSLQHLLLARREKETGFPLLHTFSWGQRNRTGRRTICFQQEHLLFPQHLIIATYWQSIQKNLGLLQVSFSIHVWGNAFQFYNAWALFLSRERDHPLDEWCGRLGTTTHQPLQDCPHHLIDLLND